MPKQNHGGADLLGSFRDFLGGVVCENHWVKASLAGIHLYLCRLMRDLENRCTFIESTGSGNEHYIAYYRNGPTKTMMLH
jgi:hypothetical protein